MSKLLTYCIALAFLSCRGASEKTVTATVPTDTIAQTATAEQKDTIKPEPQGIRVSIEKISADQFAAANTHAKANKPILKITDPELVQKKLAGILEFKDNDDYLGIKRINFRNGASSGDKEEFEEYSFMAYFPTEDILLCEGGHTTDVSFDLATGEETYEVGNPDLVTTSPNGRYRLNKVYEGQECFYHFIQKKEKQKFRKVIELGELFEKETKKWLCVTEREFWTDDFTLYFGLVTQYKEDGNEHEFYKVTIFDD